MQITVNVTDLDLDSVIGEQVEEVEPGVYEGGNLTLRAAVVQEVARQVVEKHGRGFDTSRMVTEIRDDLIREMLTPIVVAALETPAQRTNGFGEPVGEPVSMRVLVMDTARKVLAQKVDSQGRPERYAAADRTTTWASWLVEKQVREVFAQELQAELDAAKEQLRGQLKEIAAAKLAETVAGR
jgi:hypothetical protein